MRELYDLAAEIGETLKARGEKMVRHAIETGMSTTEAFRTFGIW